MVCPNWLTDCLNIQYLQEQIVLEVGDGDLWGTFCSSVSSAGPHYSKQMGLGQLVAGTWILPQHSLPTSAPLVTSRGAVKIYFACCCDIVFQDID